MSMENSNNGTAADFVLPDGQKVPIGGPGQALAYFQSTTETPERCLAEYWYFVQQLYQRGLYEVADVHLNKFLTGIPNFRKADSYLSLGNLMERRDDFGKAVEFYSKATDFHAEMDPYRRYFSNNNLGFSLIQLGRYEEAEPYCQAAIAIDPNRHNAFKNLGLACSGQGRFREGAENLLRATRICPGDRRAVGHLMDLSGKHSHELGVASEEVHSFLKRWPREQQVASTLRAIGRSLYRLQFGTDQAERKGNKAIIRRARRKIKRLERIAKNLLAETELHEALACQVHGLSLKILKDWDKAVDSFRRVIELKPDNLAGWVELIRCLVILDRESEAQDMAKWGDELGRLNFRRWNLWMYFADAVNNAKKGENCYTYEDKENMYLNLY